eukprot:403335173
MRFVVVFLNVMPLYNMNYELNEWMENKTDKKIITYLFNLVVVLNVTSYLKASFQRPKPIPKMMPQDQNQACRQCQNWKPERTHHCSICNTCVLKMDHHCPWLGNCVGIIYSIQMIKYAFFRPDEDTHDLSLVGNIFYYGTNILAVPIAFSLNFLTMSIVVQLYNNITSLERMSARQVKMPCCGSFDHGYSYPNEYDMIWLQNMKQVLGPKMWMWLLPISYEMEGNGFYFPKIPEISMQDLNLLLKDVSRVHNTSFVVNEFESDPRDYIQKAVDKYSGQKFIISRGQTEAETQEVYIPSKEEQKAMQNNLNG